MRLFASVILTIFIGFGTLFSPTGNFSCAEYVPKVYSLCVEEDPELGMADFFFEHLLNLESLIEFLENETEDNDAPLNSPYQLPQTVIQTVVTITQPIQAYFTEKYFTPQRVDYSLYQSPFKASLHADDIFHPPTA